MILEVKRSKSRKYKMCTKQKSLTTF